MPVIVPAQRRSNTVTVSRSLSFSTPTVAMRSR